MVRWPPVLFADRLNDGSFSCVLRSHLYKPAVPVPYHPMYNAGGIFFFMILHETGSRFFLSSLRQVYLLYSLSLHLCFNALQFEVSSIFILLCLLFLGSAAGRKLLDANCVGLHCRRQMSKKGWDKAEHIFTVVVKAQWSDFLLQLYGNWQLLLVPASASYAQAQ